MQRYVIDQFPGLFLGVEHTKLPPGALVDHGWSKNEPGRTLNVQVTDAGELQNSVGHTLVTAIGVPTNLSYPNRENANSIFAWTPPQGGTFFLFGHAFGVSLLKISGNPSTTGTRSYLNHTNIMADTNPSWGDVYTVGADIYSPAYPAKREGQFVPYKDRLYYCDGVGYPLRIQYGTELVAHPMGIHAHNVLSGSELGYIYAGKFRGESDVSISSGDYFVRLVTPFGKSVPYHIQGTAGSGAWTPSSGRNYNQVVLTIWDNLGGIYPIAQGADIYRTDSATGIPYHIGYVPRGVKYFLDSVPDSLVGSAMSLSYGNPSNFRMMCIFEDRMFAVGGFGNYNRIACSEFGEPDVWPALNELFLPDYGRNSDITALVEVGGSLFVFLRNSILRLQGSGPQNYSFVVVHSTIGCVSRRTIASWDRGIVFLSDKGIYSFDGTRLNPVGPGLTAHLSRGGFTPAAATIVGNQYYLSVYDSTEQMSSSRHWSDNQAYKGEYTCNKVYSVNLSNGFAGCNVTGAFVDSTSLPRGESLVLSQNYTLNQEEWRENQVILLYSKAPMYGIFSLNDLPGWPNYGTDRRETFFTLREVDMGLPDVNKVLDGLEITYSHLSERSFTVRAVRRSPRVTTGDSYAGIRFEEASSPIGDLPDTEIISRYLNTDWTDGQTFASFIPRVARVSFNRLTGKSFQFGFKVNTGATELRVHSIVVRYHVEDPAWKGADAH